MPKREYHNLRGLVRDIERALREGDYSEVAALDDVLEDFADARDRVDSCIRDAADASGEGGDAGLDVPDQRSLPGVGGGAPGHDSSSTEAVDRLARLRDQVERLVALSSSGGRVPRHVADVATTVGGRKLVGSVKKEGLT